jgi:hypothetical protein
VAVFKLTIKEVEEAIGLLEYWEQNCHGASLALVHSGLLPEGSRVARGWAQGVGSQHSWAMVAPTTTVYDGANQVVDITLHGYVPKAPRLYIAKARAWPHVPHGAGELRQKGPERLGPRIDLDVALSPSAKAFLKMWAPRGLDYKGWMTLFNGPMQGWPSRELVLAGYQTKAIRATIPIDIIGMLTDENPSKLYF